MHGISLFSQLCNMNNSKTVKQYHAVIAGWAHNSRSVLSLFFQMNKPNKVINYYSNFSVVFSDSSFGSLRGYNGCCNEIVTLKQNFAFGPVFCDYSMLVTLQKIGNVRFRFLGTNGFHVNGKNERFTAADSRCRQNLKNEISLCHLADCVKKEMHQRA